MNFKTELQSNNTELEEILASVNALPDAGSGGGGSSGGSGLETCTVTVTKDESYCVSGVQVINGVPMPIYFEFSSSENTWTAPCGSVVIIGVGFDFAYDLVNMTYIGTGSAVGDYIPAGMGAMGYESCKVFRIDAGAGETASIDAYENL